MGRGEIGIRRGVGFGGRGRCTRASSWDMVEARRRLVDSSFGNDGSAQ